ncbi:3900_t:CDS:1, partial [Gigaspora rosea]
GLQSRLVPVLNKNLGMAIDIETQAWVWAQAQKLKFIINYAWNFAWHLCPASFA